MIRVVVFEDNKHLRNTFELLLQQSEETECTGAWPDANDVIAHLNNISCDVVLMDVEMPGINGIEATKLIKANFPDIHILIQTVFDADEYIFNAICNGASGYLLKSALPDEYIAAIKDVYKGGSPMTPSIARRVIELFRNGFASKNSNEKYNLTKQEKNVLQLLVTGKSYKMIAESLNISNDTVKAHIRNVYTKLQVHSATEAVVKAIQDKIVDLVA